MKYLISLAVCSISLSASTVYDTSASLTGTRYVGSNGGLVDGGGPGYNELMLNWSIVELPDLTYDYTYTVTGFTSPNLSHFILQLSDRCVSTGGPTCLSNVEVNGSPATAVLGDYCYKGNGCQGNSNIGLPNEITGIKFSSLPSGTVSITFNSPGAPVWGDVYLSGGQQYVYDIGNANRVDPNTLDFIARPGAPSEPATPEPATLGLVGVALIALGMVKWKPRSRKRG